MKLLKPGDRGRPWLVILQIAIATGLLVWVFSDGQLRADLAEGLGKGRLGPILLGVLAAGVGIAANVWRWSIFLRIQGIRVPAPRLAAIFLIGMAFTLLGLGSLGGDAARAVLLMRDHPKRKKAIVISIFADHFSAIVALSTSAAVFAFARRSWFAQSAIGKAALGFTLAFCVIALLVLLLSVLAALDRQRKLLPRRLPAREKFVAIGDLFTPFADHLKLTILACLVSFPVLIGYFLSFYCAALSFDAGVGIGDIFAIMPVVEAVTTIPISYSGLGIREGLFREMLGAMAGTAPGVAVLISLAGFAITLFWSALGVLILPFYRRRTSGEQDTKSDA